MAETDITQTDVADKSAAKTEQPKAKAEAKAQGSATQGVVAANNPVDKPSEGEGGALGSAENGASTESEQAEPLLIKGESSTKALAKLLGLAVDEVLAFRDYGEYVNVVTNAGQKIRIERSAK